MKYFLYAGALVASALTAGYYVSAMKKKKNLTVEDINYKEFDTILSLIKSSRTPSVFAKRYANLVISERGIDAKADGYYMSVLYNWGLLSDDEFKTEACKYFTLASYEEFINMEFGEDIYTSVLVLIVNELSTHVHGGTYHCYDNLEDAVTWERLIPYLETSLIHSCDSNSLDTFVKVFNLLFSLYAQCDYTYFIKRSEEVNRILHTDDDTTLSDKDKKMFTFLSGNIDKVEEVLSTINSKYNSK